MIYVLEDDNSIRELIVYTLNAHNLKTVGFSTPDDFWSAIERDLPSMILLDIMLPVEDGIKILKKLRKLPVTSDIPIIMITAKNTEFDKVMGLDSGADDYIAKPFGMMELVARVNALMRRSAKEELDEFRVGNLYICQSKHIVTANDKNINLTLKEFELLYYLVRNKSVVFSRDKLLDRIWGYEFDGESRTVDVHIRTLRQKLGDSAKYIQTVRGIGYKAGEV